LGRKVEKGQLWQGKLKPRIVEGKSARILSSKRKPAARRPGGDESDRGEGGEEKGPQNHGEDLQEPILLYGDIVCALKEKGRAKEGRREGERHWKKIEYWLAEKDGSNLLKETLTCLKTARVPLKGKGKEVWPLSLKVQIERGIEPRMKEVRLSDSGGGDKQPRGKKPYLLGKPPVCVERKKESILPLKTKPSEGGNEF